MKYIFYILSLFSMGITLFVGVKSELSFLVIFALTPYMGLLYILTLAKSTTAVMTAKAVTVFLVLVGLYFLLDNTYMERNLGVKFSFLFIPIWQWTMLLVTGFVIYLSNTKRE